MVKTYPRDAYDVPSVDNDADDDDEHDGQKRVEVIGNDLDEQLDARDAGVQVLGRSRDRRSPRRDGRDHADGRRRGIDDV